MESTVSPQTAVICPRCRGERVFRATNIFVNGSEKRATSNTRSATGPVSPVQSLVCTSCGYLELWASEPDKLVG